MAEKECELNDFKTQPCKNSFNLNSASTTLFSVLFM